MSRLEVSIDYAENLLQWCSHVRKNYIRGLNRSGALHGVLGTFVLASEEEANEIIEMARDAQTQSDRNNRLSNSDLRKMRNVLATENDIERTIAEHQRLIDDIQKVKEQMLKLDSTRRVKMEESQKLSTTQCPTRQRCRKLNRVEAEVSRLEARVTEVSTQYETLKELEKMTILDIRKYADDHHAEIFRVELESQQRVLHNIVSFIQNFHESCLERAKVRWENLSKELADINIEDFIISAINTVAKEYVFPCVEDWHAQYGFDKPLPQPIIKKQDLPPDKKETKDYCEVTDVTRMSGVYVIATREYIPLLTSDLPFRKGDRLKQTSGVNRYGMSYGWYRRRSWGRKTYGYYPAEFVELDTRRCCS